MIPEKKIEIAYAVHDYFGDYYEYLGVSVFSVMENTEASLSFRILCDPTLTEKAREELTQLCETYGQQIFFYDIPEDERISKIRLFKCGYTEGILYRLYLPELLPEVSRILYLDADILVHGDIRELWESDLQGALLAGRWDPPLFGYKQVKEAERKQLLPFWEATDWNEYINSGVLLLDLERIRREHHLMEEALDFWNTYGFAFPDQDAINYLFRGKKQLLPVKFNVFGKDYPSVRKGTIYHYTYMAEAADQLNELDKLYLSYYERSVFYRKELDKKEKMLFLRRMKDHTEPYLRLRELTELDNEEMYSLGWGLYLRGEYERAAEYLSGCTYRAASKPAGAVTGAGCRKEDEAGDPARDEYLWRLMISGIVAMALRRLHRTEEAARVLEEAFAGGRTGNDSYIERHLIEMQQSDLLGELYYELGRYEEAERAYLGAVYFETPEKRGWAMHSLEHLIRCTLKAEKLQQAKKYYNMLQCISPVPEREGIYGLQIEIAERRAAKKEKNGGGENGRKAE